MKPNHLIREKSPYLLQHAHNPVDWYPWGEAAFAKARKEDKPIFLSIGYSTCHWCHVMEHESFEDEAIAKLMNEAFVAIKVDREERPDVDRIYMSAVQAMTGSGGWPLNAFLTPDRKPFYGGTYFPPEPRYGQPGFPQLLQRVAQLWKERRKDLASDADKLAQAISSMTAVSGRAAAPQAAWLEAAFNSFAGTFDPERGGFGHAPKFPMPVNHNFLLRYYARTGERKALDMVVFTLKQMAQGGIHDQIGGGFHRYSVDANWFVPHFEKMLYDNAQLAMNYLEAHQITRDESLALVARDTLDYVLRDLTHGEGGFFSAEDADSLPSSARSAGEGGRRPDEGQKKLEGAFYLWSYEEIQDVLSKDAESFSRHYGLHPEGNIADDPHAEFGDKNLPFQSRPIDPADAPAMAAARAKLLEIRSKRPRPGLDDKVLTSWNGLMLSALAKAAVILEERRYREAAEKAARFLHSKLYDPNSRRLYHRWREGERSIPGIADDYAFLAQGLLDLYEATFDPQWLKWALELTEAQQELFAGPDGGLYLTAADHDKNLLTRVMEDSDNVEPSSSSVAALNLLRLAEILDRKDFRKAAERTLELFGAQMRDHPRSLPQLLAVLDFALGKPRQIVIAVGADKKGAAAMLSEVHRRFLPVKVLARAEDTPEKFPPVGGKATAYVCVNRACDLPTTDPAKLKELLDNRRP